jgi:preprotein translocase subunit SecF
MIFVTYRKLFYSLIGALSLGCVLALLGWGLVFGIEFTGGTLVTFHYEGSAPSKQELDGRLETLNLGAFSLRPSENGYFLRIRELSQDEYRAVETALAENVGGTLSVDSRATVGPVIGNELKSKALVAVVVVITLIVLYVALAFRGVGSATKTSPNAKQHEEDGTVSSWSYGLIAVLVLIHDILVPLGAFALLGHFFGAEVDVLIVVGILTILGYSVNDTIVIFDRVRENIRRRREAHSNETFAEVVGHSLRETYGRSINTSLTVLIVTLALLFLGGKTTMYFALTLVVGVVAGTYSSIALAAPLLVTLEARKRKKTV